MKKFFILIFFGVFFNAVGQQPRVYNQFFMNPYLYNPAYAGVEGHSVVFAMYRQQWSNIDGAPQTIHATFHTPLQGGIGIGVMAYNQQESFISSNYGKVSGSYLITLDRKHYLRFGLSIGMGNNSLSLGELDAPDDPAFLNLVDQTSYLVGDFGVTYHFDHFNFGFSMPNLFGNDPVTDKSFSPVNFNPYDEILFKMNYRGHINYDLAIEPHIIYRYNRILPDQIEATVITHIYHVVWAGATYRQDNDVILLLGTKFKDMMAIGYAFEIGQLGIAKELGPTHEVHIGIHLGTKKHHAEHTSSFIKSHQLSAQQRAQLAEQERQKQLMELQQSRQVEQVDEDALTIAQPVAKPIEQPAEIQEDNNPWDQNEIGEVVERTNEFGEKETAIELTKINENGEEEIIISWVPASTTNESWELTNQNEAPLERIGQDGAKEIGIKYERTNADGSKETIVKWEHVLTAAQAAAVIAGGNVASAINVAPVVIQPPIETAPAEVIPEEVVPETTPIITPPPANPIGKTTGQLLPEHVEELEKGNPNLTEDFRTHEELATSNEPLEVSRGGHMLELRPGNYLVAGAFESFQNAENYSDKLFNLGFHDVIVGYISARGYYYVTLESKGNLEDVRRDRDRIKKMSGMSDVWILKVNRQ